MQLPDEYQNDPQGRDKWHRSHKEEENENRNRFLKVKRRGRNEMKEENYEEAKQLIEKIFSVNSYFYQSFSKRFLV